MTIQGLPLPPLRLDIRRAATLADYMFTRFVLALHPSAPRRAPSESTFGRVGQFEAQRAADRVGVHQPQVEPLPDREAHPAMFAVETARRLVIEEAFAAQSRHRHQPIAAEPVDRRAEAEGLHPGAPRRDDRSEERRAGKEGFSTGRYRW